MTPIRPDSLLIKCVLQSMRKACAHLAWLVIMLSAAFFTLASAAAFDRVAPGPLQCDFEGWEGGQRFELVSRNERSVYPLGMNLSFFGSRAIHESMLAAFPTLRFHPSRAPIVSADMRTGRLHVFDCGTERCSREEIARDAALACMAALASPSCRTFAVRVEKRYYCTLMPGLNQ